MRACVEIGDLLVFTKSIVSEAQVLSVLDNFAKYIGIAENVDCKLVIEWYVLDRGGVVLLVEGFVIPVNRVW